ncbi:MAG: hypothetical protein ABI867_26570 [Kofleriaceae bacterium]
MNRSILALGFVAAVASPSFADGYEPLGSIGQFGLGVVARSADAAMAAGDPDDRADFDGTFLIGKVFTPTYRVRPGGFLEVRTVSFDTLEVAVGPQVQLVLTDRLGVMLRAGVGGVAEAGNYALAGVQLGNRHLGASVIARRDFETHAVTIAASVEVSSLVAVFPIFAAVLASTTP